MDALLVVRQLQHLASDKHPPDAVRAKIPRMAVGICYFLEHPDVGVQRQAAAAARVLTETHGKLLVESTELRITLRKHGTGAADANVRHSCEAALLALQMAEKQETGEEEQQPPGDATDLASVVLGLRGIMEDPRNASVLQEAVGMPEGCRHAVNRLERDLQLRLVSVWGVCSATVALDASALSACCSDQQRGGDDGQQPQRGQGVARVLIRLFKNPKELHQQLDQLRAAVGPRTLLLNSQLVRAAPTGGNDQQDTGQECAHTSGKYLSTAEDSTGEGAFSFFSQSSNLFASSRFLGGAALLPYQDDPQLAARLKKEKEKRAQQKQSHGVVDRILGSIGVAKFW